MTNSMKGNKELNNHTQSKVSMVMPVYNKIEYIDMMLESVYNQLWDNIELILVNDGATDGTRKRLSDWEPRFRARGYEVVIVDQENQGIPGAVKAGLMCITGDYVCVVDCDDRLEPEYASTMASWLDEHGEDEWTCCLWSGFSIEQGNHIKQYTKDSAYILAPPNMIEKYLSRYHYAAIWKYLVRVSYLRECKVVERFITEIRSSQESCYLLPLIVGGGKLKIIEQSLYNYYYYPTQTSARFSASHTIDYFSNFRDITAKTIDSLDTDATLRNKWRVFNELGCNFRMILWAQAFPDGAKHLKKLASETATLLNSHFYPKLEMTKEHILENNDVLFTSVFDCILCKTLKECLFNVSNQPLTRIIAWGASGKRGSRIVPHLRGTILQPAELWDINGDGIRVKKPNTDTLTASDTVMVFPMHNANILTELTDVGCSYILYEDILSFVAMIKYPQFYGGSVRFMPLFD